MIAKFSIEERKKYIEEVKKNKQNLKDRIFVIERLGYNKKILKYLELYFKTFDYEVEIKSIENKTTKQLENNVIYDCMRLHNNKNLIIIYDGLYYDTNLDVSNPLFNEDSFLYNFTPMTFILKEKERIEEGFFKNDINITNKSIKGIFLNIIWRIHLPFKNSREIKCKIQDECSSIYNKEKHGEILSICRDTETLSFKKCLSTVKQKHLAPLQFFHYTFKIEEFPRGILLELERYRTINGMNVESTRFVLSKYDNLEHKVYKYCHPEVRKIALETLSRLKELDLPNDELKMALPECFTTNFYMKIDLRNLAHMISQRCGFDTHKTFRRLVYSMIGEMSYYHYNDCNEILSYIL